jgi:hypothetical protein
MAMTIKTPIPPALLQELDERFPDRSPDLTWTEREVWFNAGRASVCGWLREQRKLQEESLYGGLD